MGGSVAWFSTVFYAGRQQSPGSAKTNIFIVNVSIYFVKLHCSIGRKNTKHLSRRAIRNFIISFSLWG